MQLLPYQVEGAKFLSERRAALIADEMGLGKTAQLLKACDLVRAATVVVVCPASARETWRREVRKWFGSDLGVVVLYKDEEPQICALNIMSYDGLAKFGEMMKTWQTIDVLILDESHFLKSTSAKRTQLVYGWRGKEGLVHKARYVWLSSGTPMPNNPSELYPMCKSLFSVNFRKRNGAPMSKQDFIHRYCETINTGFGEKIVGGKNLEELKACIRPFFIRRKVDEVQSQMPAVRQEILPLKADAIAIARMFPEETSMIDAALVASDPVAALHMLTNHVASLRKNLGLAKLWPFYNWLMDQLEGGVDKIVVFGHHTDVLHGLADRLKRTCGVAVVTGGTPARLKGVEEEKFRTDPNCKVFIGNIQAAGTALNLQVAHRLAFIEYSWVPAENDQAACRIRRIGQKNNMLVHYAVVAGSLDERIAEAVRKKSEVINQVF